jgi:hypothetical protein
MATIKKLLVLALVFLALFAVVVRADNEEEGIGCCTPASAAPPSLSPCSRPHSCLFAAGDFTPDQVHDESDSVETEEESVSESEHESEADAESEDNSVDST